MGFGAKTPKVPEVAKVDTESAEDTATAKSRELASRRTRQTAFEAGLSKVLKSRLGE